MPFNTPQQVSIPSVSEITKMIKDVLEAGFQNVDVEGEISQPTISSNGHLYFTLKDSKAQLPCVMWRSGVQRLNFKPEHGQQVIISGDIQLYAPHGRYQLIVRSAKQAGLGALQQAFERLKIKLQNEGLFDQSKKKKLPFFPKKVGVVTSATGAALQDMINTLERRYPMLTLCIYHASVQGVNAAPEIVAGLNYFASRNDIDVVITGRGGGSLEDLWPFNEESVARAIFTSPHPVISAVGHETDFTIADFVADVRAATPTQAIAILVPDINELRYLVEDHQTRITKRLNEKVNRSKERVRYVARTYALHALKDKINTNKDYIKRLESDFKNRLNLMVIDYKHRIERCNTRLENLSPNEPLKKGFTRIWQDEKWIRTSDSFKQDLPFEIEWASGRVSK